MQQHRAPFGCQQSGTGIHVTPEKVCGSSVPVEVSVFRFSGSSFGKLLVTATTTSISHLAPLSLQRSLGTIDRA